MRRPFVRSRLRYTRDVFVSLLQRVGGKSLLPSARGAGRGAVVDVHDFLKGTVMSDDQKPTVHLIESDDAAPAIKLESGMRFEVKTTQIVDASRRPSQKVAARL